ncbi:MAG: T9SS type A sorting domain-containing protein [Chitinivibrionales bacterium]|nr:T9SS type A sorting domain-containing protein [Chitinivibrionales bacterium]
MVRTFFTTALSCILLSGITFTHGSALNNGAALEPHEAACYTCPDESIDILISYQNSSTEVPSLDNKVYRIKSVLEDAGEKVMLLRDINESKAVLLNWLSCRNLKLWARAGYGRGNQTPFPNTTPSPEEISKLDLTGKIFIFDGSLTYSQQFADAFITGANALFYCASLNRNPLELPKADFKLGMILASAVVDRKELGACVDEVNSDPQRQKYRYVHNPSSNGSCFYPRNTTALSKWSAHPSSGGISIVTTPCFIDIYHGSSSLTRILIHSIDGKMLSQINASGSHVTRYASVHAGTYIATVINGSQIVRLPFTMVK